jgi:NTE family protein
MVVFMTDNIKPINLALQGGGAHGAFAWGVLDALLEDGRIKFDGISATSAGAMNASVFAYGMVCGGNDGARQALHDFWEGVSQITVPAPIAKLLSALNSNPLLAILGGTNEMFYQVGFGMFNNFTEMFSPYQFNPLNYNPLRQVLLEHVDFERLQAESKIKLFICATNVKNNNIKIFSNNNLTVDSIMASACLSMLFQAVEIDGEFYWDGGYVGNPALYPLFYETKTDDMMVVHINPIEREQLPTKPHEIINRVNELSFNSSLLREFRAIAFIQKIIDEGWIKDEFRCNITHQKFFMHSIRADKFMDNYCVASKFNPNWQFLCELRDEGRMLTKEWLDANFQHIGVRSTMDLRKEYL